MKGGNALYQYETTILLFQPITSGSQCTNDNADQMRCNHLHSCQSCVTHTGCQWDSKLEVAMCIPITNYSSMPYYLKVCFV